MSVRTVLTSRVEQATDNKLNARIRRNGSTLCAVARCRTRWPLWWAHLRCYTIGSVKRLNLDSPAAISKQLHMQRKHAWDLEASIDWQRGIDISRPLLPLDSSAIAFPGASEEQRLAISQFVGLAIAATIFELEELLIRLKGDALGIVHRQRPVGPEFEELGELFFEEERKHSLAFQRYVSLFCETASIDEEALRSVFPSVGVLLEGYLRVNIKRSRMTFWWLVAMVEQQFLAIYHSFAPLRAELDPLYFELHRRHFEEEARHASLPYAVIDLMTETRRSPANTDWLIGQVIQVLWVAMSSIDLLRLQKVHTKHPMLGAVHRAIPLLRRQPLRRLVWRFATEMPYISALVNPTAHPTFERYRKEKGVLHIPFPQYVQNELVAH